MNYIEKARKSRVLKILFLIILIIIIFDKLLIMGCKTIYNIFEKFLYKNKPESSLEQEKKNINKNNEEFNNLDLNKYNEKNLFGSISEIFKNEKYNLGHYPNVEIKPGQELFKDNKFLPQCCMYYSDYSNDRGCPCITPEQQHYLQRRGLNRSNDSFIREYDLKNIYFSPTNVFKNNKAENKVDIFLKHDTYIKKNPEYLSDTSINYVLSILNEIQ